MKELKKCKKNFSFLFIYFIQERMKFEDQSRQSVRQMQTARHAWLASMIAVATLVVQPLCARQTKSVEFKTHYHCELSTANVHLTQCQTTTEGAKPSVSLSLPSAPMYSIHSLFNKSKYIPGQAYMSGLLLKKLINQPKFLIFIKIPSKSHFFTHLQI